MTASDTVSDGEDGSPSSISDDDPGTSGDASDDLTSGGGASRRDGGDEIAESTNRKSSDRLNKKSENKSSQ